MQRLKFGRLIHQFGWTLTVRVGRYFELCNGMMWSKQQGALCVIRIKYVK